MMASLMKAEVSSYLYFKGWLFDILDDFSKGKQA